jgi:3-oxoadipate enol-lactonase
MSLSLLSGPAIDNASAFEPEVEKRLPPSGLDALGLPIRDIVNGVYTIPQNTATMLAPNGGTAEDVAEILELKSTYIFLHDSANQGPAIASLFVDGGVFEDPYQDGSNHICGPNRYAIGRDAIAVYFGNTGPGTPITKHSHHMYSAPLVKIDSSGHFATLVASWAVFLPSSTGATWTRGGTYVDDFVKTTAGGLYTYARSMSNFQQPVSIPASQSNRLREPNRGAKPPLFHIAGVSLKVRSIAETRKGPSERDTKVMKVQDEMKPEKLRMACGDCSFHRHHGDGRPLVLLHPLALSGRSWELAREELIEGREVVAVDLRGHGDSGWSGESFTIEDIADDVATLLLALEIRQCDVVGMSMGGCVAMMLAAKRPTLVRRMALCDTTAWYGPNASAAWKKRARSAEENPRQALIPFQLDRWFSDAFRNEHPEKVQFAVETFTRTNADVHAQACRALGAFDARAVLDQIKSPTLVIAGAQDYATPASMARYLARSIPGAALTIWKGVRHFAVLESGALRRAIAGFLSENAPLPCAQSLSTTWSPPII